MRAHQSTTGRRTALAVLPVLILATGTATADTPVSVRDRFVASNPAPASSLGGLRLRSEVELRPGFTDNADWRPGDGVASAELGLRGSLEAQTEAGPNRFRLAAAGSLIHYATDRVDDTRSADLEAGVTVSASANLTLRASIGWSVQDAPVENNGIVIDGIWTRYADAPRTQALPISLGLSYDTGRFALNIDARSRHVAIDDLTTVTGLQVRQAFRSGWEHDLDARITHVDTPSLSPFAELAASHDRYDDPNANVDRYSISAGLSLEPGWLMRGELQAGYAWQDNSLGGATGGFVFAGELTWYARPLLTLGLSAERQLRAEVTTNATGVFTSRPATTDTLRLTADWEPLREMLVSLAATWNADETADTGRRDTFLTLALQAEYLINETLRARLGIERLEGESNLYGDVTRNRISVGLVSRY